jgi:hypothetical protein
MMMMVMIIKGKVCQTKQQSPRRTTPPRIPHRSFTAIIKYTVHTSCVRLDDEISTSAAH